VPLQEEILKKLAKLEGKYLIPMGLPVWGSIVKVSKDDYRVILVDDDGKLVASS